MVVIPLVSILFLKLGAVPSLLQLGDRKQPEVSPERVPQAIRLLARTVREWEVVVPHLGGVVEEAGTLVVVEEVGVQEEVARAIVEHVLRLHTRLQPLILVALLL